MNPTDGSGTRWGYCPACERWRVSDAWEASGAPPHCPSCGACPDPLERFAGAVGTTVLWLAPSAEREPVQPAQRSTAIDARGAPT